MDQEKAAQIWKEFQKLVYQDQPYTFLFWKDKAVAVNKKFKKVYIKFIKHIKSNEANSYIDEHIREITPEKFAELSLDEAKELLSKLKQLKLYYKKEQKYDKIKRKIEKKRLRRQKRRKKKEARKKKIVAVKRDTKKKELAKKETEKKPPAKKKTTSSKKK